VHCEQTVREGKERRVVSDEGGGVGPARMGYWPMSMRTPGLSCSVERNGNCAAPLPPMLLRSRPQGRRRQVHAVLAQE
jgi:hypothetical protein